MKKKKKPEGGQVTLLRKILAELRRLNANMEKRNASQAMPPQEVEDALDDDSEELDRFE